MGIGNLSDFEKIVLFIKKSEFENLSKLVIDKVKICILDTICAAAMGNLTDSAKIFKNVFLNNVENLINTNDSNNCATVWFTNKKAFLPNAILMNSNASCAMDIDDGLDLNRCHAGASIIPAILSVSEVRKISSKKAMNAIVIGYDLMFFISDYLIPYGRVGYPIDQGTGSMGAISLAASLANLFNEKDKIIRESLRVSQSFMPGGNNDLAVLQGPMTKENIGWGSFTGYLSFLLAKNGYTGQASIIENKKNPYDFEKYLYNHFAIKDTYIKSYAACRFAHWPLAAFNKLKLHNSLKNEEIKAIEVRTFKSAVNLSVSNPNNIEGVQYSIPYLLALLIKYNDINSAQIKKIYQSDPEIKVIIKKIKLYCDERFEKDYDEGEGCELRIILKNGTILKETIRGLEGDKNNPFNLTDIKNKFNNNCKEFISEKRVTKIFEIVNNFEKFEVGDLIKLLVKDYKKS